MIHRQKDRLGEEEIIGSGSKKRPPWLVMVYLVLVYLFLFLPSLVVVLMSFNSSRLSFFPLEGISLRWYQALFSDRLMWLGARNSLLVALTTMIVSTVLGLMFAYAMNRFRFPGKGFLTSLVMAPMLTPGVIIGISLLSFYYSLGIPRGLGTVLLAHVVLAIPYTTLVIASRIQGFDLSLEEAARNLGAGEWTVLRKVTLPLLWPGILAAALFAFTISVDEFVVTFFVIGERAVTLPIKIYTGVRFGISPEVNAISSLVILFSTVILGLALGRQARA
ncbi:MAG: ABC transporter permease [Anaerolineae bacterium]